MPRKLCNRNASIDSTLPLGKLQRLSEYLYDNQGQVGVSLSFDVDESGYCTISGGVSAEVKMLCQRCLEAMEVSLSSEIAVKVADTDKEIEQITQAGSDPLEKLEVILCEAGELNLLSLIEDELIMSLPIVANHENEDCSKELNSLHEQAREAQEDIDNKPAIQGLDALEKLKQALKKNTDQNE